MDGKAIYCDVKVAVSAGAVNQVRWLDKEVFIMVDEVNYQIITPKVREKLQKIKKDHVLRP